MKLYLCVSVLLHLALFIALWMFKPDYGSLKEGLSLWVVRDLLLVVYGGMVVWGCYRLLLMPGGN